jgi:hypothetical protein
MASDKRQLAVDPDAPPSEEELAESARLREALADPAKASEDAELLRALASAHAPREIDPLVHRAIVERAITGRGKPRRGVVVRVAFGVAAVFAAAALVLLFVRTRLPRPSDATAQVSISRSTQPLFAEPFAPQGGESARIDRIAMARAADLRENRFARWGVR